MAINTPDNNLLDPVFGACSFQGIDFVPKLTCPNGIHQLIVLCYESHVIDLMGLREVINDNT